MARMKKSLSEAKQRQGEKMYINGFSKNEIAEVLEVHPETINRWCIDNEWEEAKKVHNISISELKQQILQNFIDLKNGVTPKISPDQLSKIASAFERISDKKKNLAYMYDNFEILSNAIIEKGMSSRTKKDKTKYLDIAKEVREVMDYIVAKTYKEAINE